MAEKAKRKQNWNEKRKKLIPKPITGKSEQGEVKIYYLSAEELEYYRNLKPLIPEKLAYTLADRDRKYTKFRKHR